MEAPAPCPPRHRLGFFIAFESSSTEATPTVELSTKHARKQLEALTDQAKELATLAQNIQDHRAELQPASAKRSSALV